MMAEQWHRCMNQVRFPVVSYLIYHVTHQLVTFTEVAAIYLNPMHTRKSTGILISIHYPCFFAAGTYTPVIVLYQVNHRQLLQYCKLESFTYFTFCHTTIPQ